MEPGQKLGFFNIIFHLHFSLRMCLRFSSMFILFQGPPFVKVSEQNGTRVYDGLSIELLRLFSDNV